MTYTGQCSGGPDHGNLITSADVEFRVEQRLYSYLDGTADIATPVRSPRVGHYRYSWGSRSFEWRGWDDENELRQLRRDVTVLKRENLAMTEELGEYKRAAQGPDLLNR